MDATSTEDPRQYLTTTQAARYVGCQPQTLRQKRSRGDGPPFTRFGNGPGARCLYPLEALQAWLEARTFTSTAAEHVATEGR